MTAMTHPALGLPDDARRVNSISTVDIRIPAEATNGQLSVFESIVGPEEGPPMHIHANEDELFFILSGCFQLWCGDETFVVGPGATVMLPRNVPHTYRNVGAGQGRILCTCTPGGFEQFFVDVAEAKASTPAELMAIGARYGLTFLPPPAANDDAAVQDDLSLSG